MVGRRFLDIRAGSERLLARVVQVFGAAQCRHAYLFANARYTRVKLLMHDGFGVLCAARRLNQGALPSLPVPPAHNRRRRSSTPQCSACPGRASKTCAHLRGPPSVGGNPRCP
ncbi:IS66 family insertion sequence element accessory protein TnpB [Cupriavidus sp. TA19]|uniref:IS66 family insertion sequence element accessory protein TnpB n=1 Tax=Cupriavidus sp. TA19 TaxID=701108 RepID=UPI00398BE8FF